MYISNLSQDQINLYLALSQRSTAHLPVPPPIPLSGNMQKHYKDSPVKKADSRKRPAIVVSDKVTISDEGRRLLAEYRQKNGFKA